MGEPLSVEERERVERSVFPPEPVARAHEVDPADLADEVAASPQVDGERAIARVLRTGAATSGALFLSSVLLEALPRHQTASMAVDVLRKAGGSLLLVTPVARLVVAGGVLGLRGEWRYALYAAGVLGLMALAVGAGLAV